MVRRSPSAQTAGLDPPYVEGLLPPPPPHSKKTLSRSIPCAFEADAVGPALFRRIFLREFSPPDQRTWLKYRWFALQ